MRARQQEGVREEEKEEAEGLLLGQHIAVEETFCRLWETLLGPTLHMGKLRLCMGGRQP